MAIITGNYTEKQKTIIKELWQKAKRAKRKLEFEGDICSQAQHNSNLEEYNLIKDELTIALEARLLYDQHIKEAKQHLDAAEKLKRDWGF